MCLSLHQLWKVAGCLAHIQTCRYLYWCGMNLLLVFKCKRQEKKGGSKFFWWSLHWSYLAAHCKNIYHLSVFKEWGVRFSSVKYFKQYQKVQKTFYLQIYQKTTYLLNINMPSLGFGKQCNILNKKARLTAQCQLNALQNRTHADLKYTLDINTNFKLT